MHESTAVPPDRGPDGEPPLLEGLATTRSIRRYRFDPIPEQDLARILWSATRAPSGTNRQPFRFLVLRDGPGAREARSILGTSFREGWAHKCEAEGWDIDTTTRGATRRERTLQAMQRYVDDFERIPVIVLALYVRYRPGPDLLDGASVYPACQNLLLAARALGYGGCFSGWHRPVEAELGRVLHLPDDVEIALTITLGRPRGRHGPVRRRPMEELVFEDDWQQTAAWIRDPEGTRFTRGGPPR